MSNQGTLGVWSFIWCVYLGSVPHATAHTPLASSDVEISTERECKICLQTLQNQKEEWMSWCPKESKELGFPWKCLETWKSLRKSKCPACLPDDSLPPTKGQSTEEAWFKDSVQLGVRLRIQLLRIILKEMTDLHATTLAHMTSLVVWRRSAYAIYQELWQERRTFPMNLQEELHELQMEVDAKTGRVFASALKASFAQWKIEFKTTKRHILVQKELSEMHKLGSKWMEHSVLVNLTTWRGRDDVGRNAEEVPVFRSALNQYRRVAIKFLVEWNEKMFHRLFKEIEKLEYHYLWSLQRIEQKCTPRRQAAMQRHRHQLTRLCALQVEMRSFEWYDYDKFLDAFPSTRWYFHKRIDKWDKEHSSYYQKVCNHLKGGQV